MRSPKCWQRNGDDWGPAVQFGFNIPVPGDWTSNLFGAALSADCFTLYFEAARGWGRFGSNDFWQVKYTPIIDFNGDGIVDVADVCIMIEHWLTDYPLCDIGPMPWGDGIVDVQDLTVLAEHLFEEIPPAEPVE